MAIYSPELPEMEEQLRTAQCFDALSSIHAALRLKTHMVNFKNKNTRGQREGTRSCTLIDRVVLCAKSAAAKYNAARRAKLRLSGPGSWEQQLQPLLDKDIRSYADADLEANRERKKGVVLEEDRGTNAEEELEIDSGGLHRRPAGESRRVISWIWWVSSASIMERGEGLDYGKYAHLETIGRY